jgi:hypothetical protein
MRIETVLSGVLVAGLVAASSAHAQHGALAEEIWSQSFCEQAVALAGQRGESQHALNLVDCRLLNYYQPSYWQCVIAAMQADAGMKLDAARQKCLAQY